MRLVISGGYRDAKRLGALKYDALSFFNYGGCQKRGSICLEKLPSRLVLLAACNKGHA